MKNNGTLQYLVSLGFKERASLSERDSGLTCFDLEGVLTLKVPAGQKVTNIQELLSLVNLQSFEHGVAEGERRAVVKMTQFIHNRNS